jgi:hypothetical protein
MSDKILTCQTIDELLLDYLEGALDEGTNADAEAHLTSCARCTALVADLRRISAQARTLPDLAPSRDLWADISARIEAPVITLPAARERGARRFGTPWMAAAAAVLVFASSGVTYLVTSRMMEPEPLQVTDTRMITGPADEAAPAPPSIAEPPTTPPEPAVVETTPAPRARIDTPPAVRNVSGDAESQPLSAYDREIARLRTVVELRRSEMDPATVAIVEQNLRLIDAAIAQSRAALDRDPASRFLNEQLDHALAKKVELLRTVALLPNRS